MTESSPRLLVVDDQPPNIRLLEALLKPRGYTVLRASSGAQALQMINEDEIDLVGCEMLQC